MGTAEHDRGLIAVLDYGIGNLRSAEKALQHLGGRARLVTDPDQVPEAAGVVLPGVGAFAACARALAASGLWDPALAAIDAGIPFLGICVGFQLLYQSSAENPGARGLGVFDGQVAPLPDGVKHPQMQWNRLDAVGAGPAMTAGLLDRPWMYFVHSFAPPQGPETVAVCDYGGPVVAAAEHHNIWATQFHPEKSGPAGLGVLANFLRRCHAGAAPDAAPAPARGTA